MFVVLREACMIWGCGGGVGCKAVNVWDDVCVGF
jgi:hypothetical protein